MVKNRNSTRGRNQRNAETGELVLKVDGQEYAHVLRILGDGFCEAICTDGTKRICRMHGRMLKKRRIAAGDTILVGLRNYQPESAVFLRMPENEITHKKEWVGVGDITPNDNVADVILKYMPDHVRLLKAVGELPEIIKLSEEGIARDEYIEFEDGDINQI
ncbi:eukaryotic translation initiation factor 1A [Artemisia annua]|uniref:Eukaryotic translation initiation factor 1A n=1 Tax=Artemisia annua TaxID=35608 RepID=A0A2U1NLU5_ARTAN|nr:eukaryotic translation initiation factor 1A [Artemisia annua]